MLGFIFHILAMPLQSCTHRLEQALHNTPHEANNLSKLTQTAWGAQKSECIQAFGGFSHIRTFVHSKSEKEHAAAPVSHSHQDQCETQLIEVFRKDFTQKNNLSKLTTQAR